MTFLPFSKSVFAAILASVLITACQNSASHSKSVSDSHTQKINHLLALMDQRLSIASQVAKAKWNSGSAIDDARREARILADVTAQAELIGGGNGCNRALVKDFFQDQFDAGKMIQTSLFVDWNKTHPPEYQFADAPSLARDIRPQLDKLTPELIRVLCDVQPILLQPDARHYLFFQANEVIRGDVDGAVRRRALRILRKE